MQDTQTEDIMVLFSADVIKEIPLHVLATETLQFTYDTYIQQTWNLLSWNTTPCSWQVFLDVLDVLTPNNFIFTLKKSGSREF